MKAIKYQLLILATLAFSLMNALADFTADFSGSVPIYVFPPPGHSAGGYAFDFKFGPGATYSFDAFGSAPPPNIQILFGLENLDTTPPTVYPVGSKGLPPGDYRLIIYWSALPGAPSGFNEVPFTATFDSSVAPVGIVAMAPEPSQNLAGALLLGCGGLVLLRRRMLKM